MLILLGLFGFACETAGYIHYIFSIFPLGKIEVKGPARFGARGPKTGPSDRLYNEPQTHGTKIMKRFFHAGQTKTSASKKILLALFRWSKLDHPITVWYFRERSTIEVGGCDGGPELTKILFQNDAPTIMQKSQLIRW